MSFKWILFSLMCVRVRMKRWPKQRQMIFFSFIFGGKRFAWLNWTDVHHRTSLDNGRYYRRSVGHAPKRSRPLADSESNESSRGHGEFHSFSYDEATLRQLLLEYAFAISNFQIQFRCFVFDPAFFTNDEININWERPHRTCCCDSHFMIFLRFLDVKMLLVPIQFSLL